jgi:predicted RNA methylase
MYNQNIKKNSLQEENERLKKQIAELSKFRHEREGGTKKKTLDQISTPAHISEFMRDLVQQGKKEEISMVIDISCGAGSLLIPWKKTGVLLIGADLDKEALELCKQNLPQSILFKHNSLECPTPCEIKEHLFYKGATGLEKEKVSGSKKAFVLNPPFSLVEKMVSEVLKLTKKGDEVLIIVPLSIAIGTKYKKERPE